MILQGDCIERMAELEPDSIDLIVSDPPYGLNFMGKDWDKALPSVDILRQALRVLKPGAFAFWLCSPRQDLQSRMILNLEQSGFNVSFTPIYWTYAQGFPKAAAMGKLIDKRAGAEREVVGRKSDPRYNSRRETAVFSKRGDAGGTAGVGTERAGSITAPATEDAKRFEGAYAGFQPKPAVEVVLVAMKPLSEKSYIDQALANGKGVTWLDDCRIPTSGRPYSEATGDRGKGSSVNIDVGSGFARGAATKGRFPANLLVSDDALGATETRGDWARGSNRKAGTKGSWFGTRAIDTKDHFRADAGGSYSRMFDLDRWWEERWKGLSEKVRRMLPFVYAPKPSKGEKGGGCDELYTLRGGLKPDQLEAVQRECSSFTVGPWWLDKEDYLCLSASSQRCYRKGNAHVTIKPLKLMRYLIALGSRPGDVVLDPFAGSGTTGVAAKLAGRKSILIELDGRWAETARRRLDAAQEPEPWAIPGGELSW